MSIMVFCASIKLVPSRWVLLNNDPFKSLPLRSALLSVASLKSTSLMRHAFITMPSSANPKKLLSSKMHSWKRSGPGLSRLFQSPFVQSMPIILHEVNVTSLILVLVGFIKLRLQFSKRHSLNLQKEKTVSLKSHETNVQSSNSALVILTPCRLTPLKVSAKTSIRSLIVSKGAPIAFNNSLTQR